MPFNLRKGCIITAENKMFAVQEIDFLARTNQAALTATEIPREAYFDYVTAIKKSPELDFKNQYLS
jgi:hypothetical protein